MVYNATNNSVFAPKGYNDLSNERLVEDAKRKIKKRKAKMEYAKTIDSFGGKRFLGLTPKGNRVFASYTVYKDGNLKIDFTHNLSVLLQEGSMFAGQRYTYKHNEKIYDTDEQLTRKISHQRGEVTVRTLYWLQRLKNLADAKNYKGFDKKKKVTKFFLSKVAHAIYVGGGTGDTEISYADLYRAWDFPEYDPYFNPETVYSYPDEL